MSFANSEPASLQPVLSDDEDVNEEPDQVSESVPEEESEEEPVGDAEGAYSDTNSGETVPYSLQGVVGLYGSGLGRLNGRVTMGETQLAAVEQGAVVTGQRDARTDECLDSFAALTIVKTMLLAFALLRGWFY
ncbi:hypothetical protein L1987_40388 [Smallanthus sonchifolius]|uniref:Uncharacterized protein n=1 Tax=Smallanthus sonchifolius TaxID=185202 RepID=A0ACB9GSS2_9ASTR|nr:hypothetical protein L1987_40388 [Smallanthus sonchifolius]